MTTVEKIHDVFRVDYLKGYITNLKYAATLDGVKVIGYFAWSFMDNFEWQDGYDKRLGLVFVDYDNNQTRYLKDSAFWYS